MTAFQSSDGREQQNLPRVEASSSLRRMTAPSDFGSLNQEQSLLHVDPRISDSVFNLGMAEQDLDGADTGLTDSRSCSAFPMRAWWLIHWKNGRNLPLVGRARSCSSQQQACAALRQGFYLRDECPDLVSEESI